MTNLLLVGGGFIAVLVLFMGTTMALYKMRQRRAARVALRARFTRMLRDNRGEVLTMALCLIAALGLAALVTGAAYHAMQPVADIMGQLPK